METVFNILIIDDNPNNLFTLRTLLGRLQNSQVYEASSGMDALEATLEHDIHLILLDVQMPEMDGFETARHLKMMDRTRDIPIVFLTAVFKTKEFIERGYNLGAVDYLTKPLDDNLLLNRITLYRQLFERQRQLESALKALHASEAKLEQRYELIMRAAGEGLFGVDAGGLVTFINDAGQKLLGWQEEDVIGCSSHDLFHGKTQEGQTYSRATCPICAALKDGNTHYGEDDVFWRKDGTSFPIEFISTPILEGNSIAGAVVSFRDITRRKEMTEQLKTTKRSAEIANRAKSEFLANMSHELRTPLNSIIGFSEMMQMETFGPLSDQYLEYSRLVTNSGRLLLETVNSILDLAKIEAGKFELELEPIDLRKTLDEVLSLIGILAMQKGLEIRNETSDLPILNVDAMRVRQVFMNTIGNAIKFTDSGTIKITNFCDDTSCNIIVSDTGIGMSPDQVKVALKPFHQVHGTSFAKPYQGTGLGLPLCSKIMELHGGQLTINSAPGEGTSVTLSFSKALA